MKCPVCEDLKMKSCVHILSSSTTLIGGMNPYYDEDGEYHNHDTNWVSTAYSCTRGHKWGETRQNPCDNPKCSWGK